MDWDPRSGRELNSCLVLLDRQKFQARECATSMMMEHIARLSSMERWSMRIGVLPRLVSQGSDLPLLVSLAERRRSNETQTILVAFSARSSGASVNSRTRLVATKVRQTHLQLTPKMVRVLFHREQIWISRRERSARAVCRFLQGRSCARRHRIRKHIMPNASEMDTVTLHQSRRRPLPGHLCKRRFHRQHHGQSR